MFFKIVMVVSNLLGIMTIIFITIGESLNSDPNNLIQFAMSSDLPEYFLMNLTPSSFTT